MGPIDWVPTAVLNRRKKNKKEKTLLDDLIMRNAVSKQKEYGYFDYGKHTKG